MFIVMDMLKLRYTRGAWKASECGFEGGGVQVVFIVEVDVGLR